jgi:hypothetical protein
MKEIGLWEDLAKKTHDLDCILHMGDQVFLTGFHGYFRNLNVFLVSLCRACVRWVFNSIETPSCGSRSIKGHSKLPAHCVTALPFTALSAVAAAAAVTACTEIDGARTSLPTVTARL